MSLLYKMRYEFMKEAGAPAFMRISELMKKKKKPKKISLFAPQMEASHRLKEVMTRHYLLARYAKNAMPVAWVTSGAPVELLRTFDFYTVYPENHGAFCGAKKMGPQMSSFAEEKGYSPDLCSYARIDLGHLFSGNTPVGKLPKPDLLVCSNNICQTIMYWFKLLAEYLKVPLIIFDTPFHFPDFAEHRIQYMVKQLEEMIPTLEQITRKSFDHAKFTKIISLSKDSSLLWGEILKTMQHSPAPMTIFDAFGYMAPIVSLRGLPVTLNYYEALLKELQERVRTNTAGMKNEKKRLLWDNIAIWFKVADLANLFANRGANIVAATYTNAWAETSPLMDTRKPFESMAKAYSYILLNTSLKNRFSLMSGIIKDYKIDGIVIHAAKSCKPYSIGQYDLKKELMDNLEIPSVIIDGDITDLRFFSEEQTNTRLEAFFESLGL